MQSSFIVIKWTVTKHTRATIRVYIGRRVIKQYTEKGRTWRGKRWDTWRKDCKRYYLKRGRRKSSIYACGISNGKIYWNKHWRWQDIMIGVCLIERTWVKEASRWSSMTTRKNSVWDSRAGGTIWGCTYHWQVCLWKCEFITENPLKRRG